MNWLRPDWPAANNVQAAVTLRTGGVSQGAYKSLNPALHVNDESKNIFQNRQKIKQMLKLPAEPVWLQQIHSNRVIKAENNKPLTQADASYTDQAGIVCTVMTADCLPVLLSSVDGSEIAAIHAGWRGLLAGIISNTLAQFKSSQVLAWLGPAIGPKCFEVGKEVEQAFNNKSSQFNPAFESKNNDKFLANIYQLASIELSMRGVTKIYGGNFCTVSDNQRFFSYRRDGETGRMATLIWRA